MIEWTCKNVSKQDWLYLFAYAAMSSRDGRYATFDYLRKNYKELCEQLNAAIMLFDRIVEYSCSLFYNKEHIDEVNDFLDKNPFDKLIKCYDRIREKLNTNNKLYSDISGSDINNIEFWKKLNN